MLKKSLALAAFLSTSMLIVGCGKVDEIKDKAKNLEEITKAGLALKESYDKDIKPVDDEVAKVSEKAKTATGDEKKKLEDTLKDIGGMKELIKEKLGKLSDIKDMKGIDELKKFITDTIAGMKSKLGMK